MLIKQQKSNYKTLIETGTYCGDMINSQKNNFKKIVSIELDYKLYNKAIKKFNKYKHIKIINGDSAIVLENLCKEINDSVIFWLDGHYSGIGTSKGEKETPIYEELDSIFNNNINHIILIDDARCFNGECDYPTLNELFQIVNKKEKNYNIEVKNDIIRIIPKSILNSKIYP